MRGGRNLAAVLALSLGCSDKDATETETGPIDVVDMASYLAACEAELGPLPPLSCSEGTLIPVTHHGEEVGLPSELPNGQCDRPGITGCATGARISVVYNEQGTPWVLACRSYDEDPTLYEQLNLIGWDFETGATCFINTPHHDVSFDGEDLPRPGSPEDVHGDEPFWYTLDRLGNASCVECHSNDPWLRNPWIEQAGVLPAGNPLGPFEPIAHDVLLGYDSLWEMPPSLVHPDAAACTTCHRLTPGRVCTMALDATGRSKHGKTSPEYRQYPRSIWMPQYENSLPLEEWEAAYSLAADTLELCCGENPPAACWD